tara:strand:- start:249 stop:593 length:345 start_codon:yes stop_codon:yes gene_type:complete
MKEDFMNNITVEIKKRYDSCYNVWQWISLADLFKPNVEESILKEVKAAYLSVFHEYSWRDIENFGKDTTGIPKSCGKWIIVNVLKNKREATEYCKSTWGQKCFKEKKGLSVTYI